MESQALLLDILRVLESQSRAVRVLRAEIHTLRQAILESGVGETVGRYLKDHGDSDVQAALGASDPAVSSLSTRIQDGP
jgi:hypothetical protein